MVLLFFWPLPPILFTVLVGIIICGTVCIYLFRPDRAWQWAKQLCTFYSLATILYVVYFFTLGDRAGTLHTDVGVTSALIELAVLALIGIMVYFMMKNKLKRERI